MIHGEAGKGDRTRPFDQKKWSEGWDRAFGGKPMLISEELEQANVYLTEIRKETKEKYHTTKFLIDRAIWSQFTTFMGIDASVTVDCLAETVSKSLICERLIKAHQSILTQAQQTIEKLQRIKDKTEGRT